MFMVFCRAQIEPLFAHMWQSGIIRNTWRIRYQVACVHACCCICSIF